MNDRHANRGGGRRRATLAAGAALVLAFGGAALTGCSAGVRWVGPTYADAYAQAKAARQLTFVYFRNWYMTTCTDFEEHVLKNPEVLREVGDMTCVPLNFDWDRSLAAQWQIAAPPAVVIVAPDGTVLARLQAPLTRADLLAQIRAAKTQFAAGAAASAPARP